jgi:type II secretory pathway pseudopilin PulG
MKKRMITGMIAVFTLVLAANVSGQSKTEEKIAQKVLEGSFYAYQFELLKKMALNLPQQKDVPQTTTSNSSKPKLDLSQGDNKGSQYSTTSRTGETTQFGTSSSTSSNSSQYLSRGGKGNPNRYSSKTYGVQTPRMSNTAPSEQDIDRAISTYETALKEWPRGKKNESIQAVFDIDGIVIVNVTKSEVEALLASAKNAKQQWLTVEKPRMEQQLAAARQAEQERQQAAQQAEQERQQAEQERQQAAEAQRLADEAPNSTPNSPEDFDVAQNTDGGITITNYKGTRKHVVIPDTLYGLKVTRIGEGAFNRKGLLSVVIPNTVTVIGSGGANDTISFTTSNSGVFRGNPLTEVIIPNSVTTIGQEAFRDCQLTEVTIPNSVTTIGEDAFRNCKLTSLTLGTGIRQIGGGAFRDNRLATLSIPNGITLIGYNAFNGNPLATLVIPASLATWEGERQSAFGMTALVTTRGLRDDVFGNTAGLTRITLPANMHDNNLVEFGSDIGNYYISQGKRAGTYVKNGPVWVRE